MEVLLVGGFADQWQQNAVPENRPQVLVKSGLIQINLASSFDKTEIIPSVL